MPYAPGIQDISGQLIAQGMSQAGAARARAIESLGESISGGIRQYQQNRILTQQAIGKFGQGLENPEFKTYITSILSDDPNAPQVSPAIKTAVKNAQKGNVDVYDAAMLSSIVDTFAKSKEQQSQDVLRKAQAANLFAQAEKAKTPAPMQGQPMTMQQIEELRGRGYDVNAVPTSNPNIVMVKGLSPRAPAAPVAPTVVPSTGATLINPVTGQREIVPALPDIPTGYEMVPPTAAAAPTPAPAPTATTPPPGLSRFAAAAAAPSGGPMAALGQFAPPPQAAARPAAASAPAGTRMAVRPLEGSPQAAQLAEAAASRAAATTRRIESADAAIQSLDKVLERVSPLSVGVGSLLKGIPSTEAANINALLKNVQASTAFNELKDLKEDKTTLGQVAVKEIELLQNAATALDMSMSPELFKEQALQLKARFETTKRRLMLLDEERRQGRTAPSDAYYQAGGLPLDALNKLSTAPTAGEDPTAALRAQGWTVKKK